MQLIRGVEREREEREEDGGDASGGVQGQVGGLIREERELFREGRGEMGYFPLIRLSRFLPGQLGWGIPPIPVVFGYKGGYPPFVPKPNTGIEKKCTAVLHPTLSLGLIAYGSV